MARLYEMYKDKIRPQLQKELKLKNIYAVPALEKIVLNMGVGGAAHDSKVLQAALDDLMAISGQRPVVTKSKHSIAGFKLRQGMGIGVKVTLRKARMYEFLDRLVNIALPRVRDFRGLSTRSFDSNGNFALGIKEQIIFPEINYDKVDKIRGMDIIICTTTSDNSQALTLLKAFNMPFTH